MFLRFIFTTAHCGAFFDAALNNSVVVTDFLVDRIQNSWGLWVADIITYVLGNAFLLWLAIIYLLFQRSADNYRVSQLNEVSQDRAIMDAARNSQQASRIEVLEKEVRRWKERCKSLISQVGGDQDIAEELHQEGET